MQALGQLFNDNANTLQQNVGQGGIQFILQVDGHV